LAQAPQPQSGFGDGLIRQESTAANSVQLNMVTAVERHSAAVMIRGLEADSSTSGLADCEQPPAGAAVPDDLARDVYCVLGLPIDAIELSEAVRRINVAALGATPFLISTVNVNFLVTSTANAEFRESVVQSDLCLADGMPVVWIARLLGLPIKHRVAGSDILDALSAAQSTPRPLKLFIFGGAQGVAATAADALNAKKSGLRCVGSIYPGYGSVEDMSQDANIDAINASNADMLIAALGALKGQTWLLRNHHRLRIPVRSHFGAAVNFAAGKIARAPPILQHLGLEWLWRIWEEPRLWWRYAYDGGVLVRLLITRVVPLAITERLQGLRNPRELRIEQSQDDSTVVLALSGDATGRHVPKAASSFRRVLAGGQRLAIDLSSVRFIDSRFFGLLLTLRKQLKSRDSNLKFIGISHRLERIFRRHGLEFLLTD
jgi:N-acetylglucosaminyldiphosphoundecaprenol N-acetyl-beta-D-mannosaminyltransferase